MKRSFKCENDGDRRNTGRRTTCVTGRRELASPREPAVYAAPVHAFLLRRLDDAMNYKFRKRPVEVEAFQMTKDRRQDNRDWPEWLNAAWNMDRNEPGAVSPQDFPESDGTDRLEITTLEGVMEVNWDDYIIRGVKGELYPCKPDIFEATYDAA